MAKFIIIRGTKDSGKTTTAGLVYIELLKIAETKHSFNGKDVETNSLEYNKENGNLIDFKVILTIKSKKIGIVSAGDVANWLEKDIDNFIKENLDIIICCTRSRNVKGSGQRMIIEKFSINNQILKEVWSKRSPIKDDKEIIKIQSEAKLTQAI